MKTLIKTVKDDAYDFLNDRIEYIVNEGVSSGKTNDGNPLFEYDGALFVLNEKLDKILQIHDLL